MRDPRDIIIEPVLTEKAMRLKDEANQYVFKVAMDANKIEIKRALEARFDVKVKSVRTMIVKGKPRQRFTRSGLVRGYTSRWKKAIVTLEEGSKFDFLENV
ncbi:MAG: 50S ribosomal protein L23 [Calditrichaeota bacterium]|nr:50S ribosomal protein L23 [Calditrichota bacterium]